MPILPLRASLSALGAATTLALAACGGGSDDAAVPDRETVIDTAGRLAITAEASTAVRIFDLDTRTVAGSFALPDVPSALYASPDRRYALAVQRTQDMVHVVDGGVWQEDHGDHLHDYLQAPALLNFTVSGVRPTHYESHEGLAAFFMDGVDGVTPAEAVLLTDAGLGAGKVDAKLPLPQAMHGTAEPRGDFMLTTFRPVGAASTSPNQVELHRRAGAGYTFVERFAPACPGLHGSFSNAGHTAFGCTDGVLVVSQNGSTFTARKIANPADMGAGVRIGTVTGHHDLAQLVGIASPGHLFAIDPVAGSISRITWADGRTRRAHAFDAEGKNLLVLDDLGVTHVLDAANQWAVRASVPTIDTMPAAAPFPSIAVSGRSPVAFVSDPLGRRLVELDLTTPKVAERRALDFSPTGLVWLGVAVHDHD